MIEEEEFKIRRPSDFILVLKQDYQFLINEYLPCPAS